MSEFLFLFKGGRPYNPDTPVEVMQKQMEAWNKWGLKLRDNGQLVATDRLSTDRKIVTSKTMVTDGPYAEGKEIVGGYMIVNANDLNEATEISKDCPIFDYDGLVEVREIVKMEM
jgi:hypothetical protein